MGKIRDFYFKKAKEERYYARSVYKLMEIDEKYHLLKRGLNVLDIGCIPGSWSQYILEKIGDGRVIGIDTSGEIKLKDPRFTFIKGDIHSIEESLLSQDGKPFDLITSDALPSTTGSRFMDSQRSLDIVRRVFQISGKILKPEGWVVAKVFQGEDLKGFIQILKEDFLEVSLFKPKSSKKESREIFIITHHRRLKGDRK